MTPNHPEENNSDYQPVAQPCCANCGRNAYGEKFHNNICPECRASFIKYPIPKWIWAFAAGILIVMGIGFTRMQEFFSHAIHLARAEKAMDEHKYVTARRELELVLAKFPDRLELNADMMIASAYNHDLQRMGKAYDKISDSEFKDQELLEKVQTAMDYVMMMTDMDTLLTPRIESIGKASVPELDRFVAELDTTDYRNKDIVYAIIANGFYELDMYSRCEALLNKILERQPDFYSASVLMMAVKRSTGRYDEAINIGKSLLNRNQEDVVALSQLAKIELKRSNDSKAAEWAAKAMKIERTTASMEAQAMVDFYSGDKSESQHLLADIQKQEIAEGDSTISVRLKKLFSGKQKFR
jgi:tetratricopeptide (TPR) repeat protein